MALTSSQIHQLCIASSNSKISDQSDKIKLPLIDISDPSTATARYTTIVWSWWKITDSVRRQNINLKHSTSIPLTSPKQISSPKPPTVTVAPIVRSTVTNLAPSDVQKSVTTTQPAALPTTAKSAISTVTTGQMDKSTTSKSETRRENVEKKLKIFREINRVLQVLRVFMG